MSLIAYLIILICSPWSHPDDVPYVESFESIHCGHMGGELCCEFTYLIDQYCCPDGEKGCEDDCDEAKRASDRLNALHSTEQWCMIRPWLWRIESYGYH